MKKQLEQQIEIPEGVEAKIEEGMLIVTGPEGEDKRKFESTGLVFEIKDNKIIIGHKKATKSEKKRINTITAHIKNLLKGVQEKFEYKLKIASSHFPITVKVEGNEIIIKNFLGEKIDRKTTFPKGAEVKVDKDIITITSINKELAGQAAANLETATKIRGRDRRVFQDGIYITSKGGKEI